MTGDVMEGAGEHEVTVRMLSLLDGHRKRRGLPSTVRLDVGPEGRSARDIAGDLGLPLERIEGVFLNHCESGLDVTVRPGDRVAFVPYGTPASHPAFFGEFDKGAETPAEGRIGEHQAEEPG